jgi:hypothetical protein
MPFGRSQSPWSICLVYVLVYVLRLCENSNTNNTKCIKYILCCVVDVHVLAGTDQSFHSPCRRKGRFEKNESNIYVIIHV